MKKKFVMALVCLMLVASMVIAPVGALAASKTIKILKVTADGARLRKGPSSSYGIITSCKKGTVVFYLNKRSGAFAKVRTSTGKVGYMYKGFLKSYGAAPANHIYYCSASSATVYKKASTKAARATRLTKNQHVIVYQVKGSWAYIKTLSGKGGFIKKSALKKAL